MCIGPNNYRCFDLYKLYLMNVVAEGRGTNIFHKKYVDASIASLYEVRYTGIYQNKTAVVSVQIVTDSSWPVINDTMALREVPKRASAKITCKATGLPEPHYQWSYKNKTLKAGSSGKLVLVDPQTVIVTDVTSDVILTCTATNLLGSNTARFLIKPVEMTEQQIFINRMFPVFVCLLLLSVTSCVCYFFYTKHRIAQLKGRRTDSPAGSSITASDTIFGEFCRHLAGVTKPDRVKGPLRDPLGTLLGLSFCMSIFVHELQVLSCTAGTLYLVEDTKLRGSRSGDKWRGRFSFGAE
eukprot:sb/3467467/